MGFYLAIVSHLRLQYRVIDLSVEGKIEIPARKISYQLIKGITR